MTKEEKLEEKLKELGYKCNFKNHAYKIAE